MRRTSTLRRAAVAAAAPLLLGGLAACGSSDEASDDTSAEQAAEDLPGEGEEVDPQDFMDDLEAGLEASTTARTTMSVDYGSGSMEAEGEVDYTTDPPEIAMTIGDLGMGTGSMEMRLVDGVMYMNMGPMTNDKFVRIDLGDTKSLPPALAGLGELEGQMDPLSAMRDLEDALTSVTFIGTEELEGDEVNRFELVTDTSKIDMLQEMPAEAGLPDELTYELWLDGDYRMRKADMTFELESGPVGEITTVYTMSNWGEPVDVEAPADSDVIEPSEMGMQAS